MEVVNTKGVTIHSYREILWSFELDGDKACLKIGICSHRFQRTVVTEQSPKYYIKGHITVFLSLMLTLILSLVCTTVESARLQGVRMQIQNITDMGIFSVFGEYNRDLLDMYDLFFIDMGYGTADGSRERVNTHIKDYVQYNADTNQGISALSLFRRADMWRTEIDRVFTDKYVLATDRNAKAYYSQAVSYMKNKLGISIAENLISQYDTGIAEAQSVFETEENSSSAMENQIEGGKAEYQTSYEAALEDADGDESKVDMEKPGEVENPLDTIKTIKSMSILQLVMEDYASISEKRIENVDQVPSKRHLKKGDGTFQAQEDNAINKALFNEYLFEKFPHYLSKESNASDSVLDYQAEYILCGKNSDEANLTGVVKKLLLKREGINFVYLLADHIKMTEAEALATAIIGYIPVLVPALTTLILLAWAFAESVIEVRMLLSGKKVALLKSSQNWKLQLANLSNLTEMLDGGEDEEGGIDYEGYLKMLIFFENSNKKIMRSLDLIELNIQTKSNSNFKIDNCTQGFTTTISVEVGSLFLRLPFKTIERGSNSYHYTITRDFSYY